MRWSSLSVFTGCGSGDPESQEKSTSKPPKIVSFVADPEEVREGESTTLSWKTENAKSIEIWYDDLEVPLPNDSLPDGSVEVTPEDDTTYFLYVEGENGEKVEATVHVALIRLGKPSIVEFTADPEPITHGDKGALRWTVRDAASVKLYEGENVIHEAEALEGSFEVEPERTTTYAIVASRDEHEARAELTLLVAPRIVRFEVEPSIATGTENEPALVDVSWEVEGVESIELLGNGNAIDISDLKPTSDVARFTMPLPGTYHFTLVAHGGEARRPPPKPRRR